MSVAGASAAGKAVDGVDLGLYALTVLVWSTSWVAMQFQLGTVEIIVSVFYRFAIAVAIMFAWVRLSGRQVWFPARLHLRFALMGVLMFSWNFALFYTAAQWVTSGLLAVVFSLVTILNPLNAAIVLRERPEPRVLAAALIGVCGVALIFWPEIASAGRDVLIGLVLAITGAVFFSLGNIVAASVQRQGYPVVPSNAWGMVYGMLSLLAIVLVTGAPFNFDARFAYVSSLLVLAISSTVIAFASYLTLMRRIGPGRAGYATVMFPIGALAISWAFEGYQWSAPAIAGLCLALAGNVLVLRRRPAPALGA